MTNDDIHNKIKNIINNINNKNYNNYVTNDDIKNIIYNINYNNKNYDIYMTSDDNSNIKNILNNNQNKSKKGLYNSSQLFRIKQKVELKNKTGK